MAAHPPPPQDPNVTNNAGGLAPPDAPSGVPAGSGSGGSSRVPVSIEEELRTSYLDYSMSVIIGRAIPDVRDGLKPVHRRVLYSMQEQGIRANGPHRKSARVVGDVLGKYHPHGDQSVYDALARLAQPWSMRYPLIDGQGNFGSVDGDPPAAMRYTEARLSRVSAELLADIDKDTVDFIPNFDDSEQEPSVLPCKFPNLLVNGSGGIAVGMATNIPPHNLGEIIDATVHLIRNPEVTVLELMQHVPGPDFPTGGMIFGTEGIRQAYLTGRGRVLMRAKTEVKKLGKGAREQIVVTGIPYQVNKANLVAKIAELIREKRIEGVSNVEDHSDRDGMSIAIELKKDVYPQVVLNQLYKLTELQTSFGVINLVIVGGRPKVLDLKETLAEFVHHRREVVTRRTRFELRQAEAQFELVEGLGMALTELDLVIETIRRAPHRDAAREGLMALKLHGLEAFVARAGRPAAEIAEARLKPEYTLSERQANAILDMRLARLTGLEREKLEAEYNELGNTIARLKAILASEKLLFEVIVGELEAIKAQYADARRTEIVPDEAEIALEDLIQEEDMVVTISHGGYVKRTPVATYRAQKRGGKGKLGMEARDEDWVNQLFVASTHAYVFFFSDRGKVYVKKVYEVPLAARNAKGRAIVNFVGMEPGEKVAAIVEVPKMEPGRFIVTLTKGGTIKKTELTDYENFREKGIIGVKIEGDDQLLSAALTDGSRQIMIGTRDGMSIRFPEEQVRSMGRATVGVKGIELREGDQVVGLAITEEGADQVLAITERGYGKRTPLEQFREQKRGGVGVALIDTGERNGSCVGLKLVKPEHEIMLITDRGQTIRTRVAEIRETKDRGALGVRVMTLDEAERVVAFERLAESDTETELAGGDGGSTPPEGGSEPETGLTPSTGSEPPEPIGEA
ncbi:MAG: DNA gyrase subunit A [Deltaproteobacteria bacterium]|nr:DNA gyrase subunit A [Deltaproteobacteria bacterium]